MFIQTDGESLVKTTHDLSVLVPVLATAIMQVCYVRISSVSHKKVCLSSTFGMKALRRVN